MAGEISADALAQYPLESEHPCFHCTFPLSVRFARIPDAPGFNTNRRAYRCLGCGRKWWTDDKCGNDCYPLDAEVKA